MPAPAIILVRPQLGANIGMTARAMANFGLSDLRLVSPRDGWPNPDAGPAASGADHVLRDTRVFDSIDEALFDCRLTFATTARPRGLSKPVATPRQAVRAMRAAQDGGMKAGILFGPERAGLTADDLATVGTIIACPVDPGFSSLNLAQAVLIVAYEHFQTKEGAAPPPLAPADAGPAPHGEVAGLIAHLDRELEAAGFFHVPDRTPATRRTLAHMLTRARFSSDEVRTLRGVVRALSELRRRRAAAAG